MWLIESRVSSFGGTSAAAPFAAGVAALYLDLYPIAYPSQVNNALKVNATSGTLTLNNPFQGTPNKLLYTYW